MSDPLHKIFALPDDTQPCQQHTNFPGGHHMCRCLMDRLIRAESALAQLTTERDHCRAALQEVNALALEAAAKYDEERKRAAILTEQRDEAVAQSIGLAQESDRLLDVHTELGLTDDGDAVAEIKKLREELAISEQTRRAHHIVMDSQSAEIVVLRQRAETAEANALVLHLALRKATERIQQKEEWAGDVALWLDEKELKPILKLREADNPGAAYLAIVQAAKKRRAAEHALAARLIRERGPAQEIVEIVWGTDAWPEYRDMTEGDLEITAAVDALNAPKGAQ